MPFYPAPGVARIVLSGLYGGAEKIVSVLHVQRKNDGLLDPWTAAQLADICNRVSGAWQQWLPQLSGQVNWNEVRGRDMSSEFGAVALVPTALTGGTASAPTAPSNAVLIQWRTGTAGRGANGRTYLPGALEGQVDPMGRLETAFVTDMTQRAGAVLVDLARATSAVWLGPPLDLVVLHGPKGVPLAASATTVVTGKCSNVIGTQRRRLPKRA
jgi:hypothetical protein